MAFVYFRDTRINNQDVFSLLETFDLIKFKNAWKQVADNHTILRSSFISTSTGIHQILWKQDFSEWNLLESWKQEDIETNLELLLKNEEKM